jgi:molecular chaperone GrpE
MAKKDNDDATNQLFTQQQVEELTLDLQRTRADFENYRKRVESDIASARDHGTSSAILKLLPVIDNIERAIRYVPKDLENDTWVQGVTGLIKNLEKSMESLNLQRIDASVGTAFNPDYHEAIQFDEDAEGEHEVVAEELQSGYMLKGRPMRHAMVKVTRTDDLNIANSVDSNDGPAENVVM